MVLNLCPEAISVKPVSFKSTLSLALKWGFGGLDFQPAQFSDSEEARDAGEQVRGNDLKWGLFYLPGDLLQGSDATFKDGLAQLAKMMPSVEAAGCHLTYSHVWPGCEDRTYHENFTWHVARLQAIVSILSAHGVRMGLEYIGAKTLRDGFRHPFLHTMEGALELADAVSPDLGIALDCFHWFTSGGTLVDLRKKGLAQRIVNVHANDAAAGRSRDEQQDMERAMPMASGLVDAPGILRVLNDEGYEGPVICEPFWPTRDRFGAMDADEVLHEVSDVMHALFSEAGIA